MLGWFVFVAISGNTEMLAVKRTGGNQKEVLIVYCSEESMQTQRSS